MTEQDKSKIASLLDDHDPAISSLYRESAQGMPPTSLDDQILRAAHAAVATQEETPTTHKPRRPWPLLGGLAASVLVAVLAVKLLPHSIQSPPSVLEERPMLGSSEADSLSPKSAALPTDTARAFQPSSPAAALEKPLQQEAPTLNLADESAAKAERKSTAGMAADRAENVTPGIATEAPKEMGAESSNIRDDEFNSIVALWKAGKTTEATARFEAFQKQYPDYTPDETNLDVFQALQSELKKNQPNGDAAN